MAGLNPYAPGMATTPPRLAGRDNELDFFAETAARAQAGLTTQVPVLLGRRGLGKTVLLDHFVHTLRNQGWPAVRLSAGPGAPAGLAGQILGVGDELAAPFLKAGGQRLQDTLGMVAEVRLGVNLGVAHGEVTYRRDTPPPIVAAAATRRLLLTLGAIAAEQHLGVAIMFDELQAATPADLEDAGQLTQLPGSERIPVVFACAGLPGLRELAAAHAGTTFTERARWFELDYLTPLATRQALEEPATDLGVHFSPAAIERLISETRGYPFLVQLAGSCTWTAARGSSTITAEHVEEGMRLVDDQLRQGQFALRWNKCSEREREYLRALAALEPENGNGLVSSAAVAGRLGERPEAVSFLRARLIAKDVIEAGPRHTIGFALPRFEHFVRKQAVDDPIEGELEPGHGPNASDLSKRTRPSRERRGRRDFTR